MQSIPSLKYIEGFKVTGFCIRTKNSDELHKETAKIPNLWQQFYASDLASHTNVFGVYSDFESDANGFYTLTAGITSDAVKSQLSSVTVQTGNYLVFQGKGPMPSTVIETWKRVWNYFKESRDYQRNFISDFEAYSGTNEVIIYIGIKYEDLT